MKRRISTSTLLENWRSCGTWCDDCTNCDRCFWHNNKRIIKRPEWLGSWRTGRDYPNDSITENGQNTEKSPGDMRKLAVTQTPVKNHQLILMWETLKGWIIMIIIIIIRMAIEMNRCFQETDVHKWMNKGNNDTDPKTPSQKALDPKNYISITCLSRMRKIVRHKLGRIDTRWWAVDCSLRKRKDSTKKKQEGQES